MPLPTTKGKLIVFEGIDGTGKSTQLQLLSAFLQSLGYSVISGFEPTSGKWGKILRSSMTKGRLSQEEELDLFYKDRLDNVQNFIQPHLDKGDIVLLDRYYFSMMAYQGARGANPNVIREKNELFAPQPHLVIWLDLPIHEALARIGGRGEANEFEKEESLSKCRSIFASIDEPWFIQVSALGSFEQISGRIQDLVRKHVLTPKTTSLN